MWKLKNHKTYIIIEDQNGRCAGTWHAVADPITGKSYIPSFYISDGRRLVRVLNTIERYQRLMGAAADEHEERQFKSVLWMKKLKAASLENLFND